MLQIRNEYREVRDQLEKSEEESTNLKINLSEQDKETERLKHQIRQLSLASNNSEQKFVNHNEENKECSSSNKSEENVNRRLQLSEKEGFNRDFIHFSYASSNSECDEVNKLKVEMEIKRKNFDKERRIWAQEKEKVLKYQRQLQMNYIQMYRRTKSLEAEIESLTIELELDKTGIKNNFNNTDTTHTIEL